MLSLWQFVFTIWNEFELSSVTQKIFAGTQLRSQSILTFFEVTVANKPGKILMRKIKGIVERETSIVARSAESKACP